jgi:hypothetical protein
MTKYHATKSTYPEHSFIECNGGRAYAEYGSLKTYSNRKQALRKCESLNALGFNVSITISHPFLIVEVKQ